MTIHFEFTAPIEKRAGLLRGVIYKSNAVDSQGDWVSSDTLELMAHDGLASGLTIDVQHDGRDCGAKLVESYVTDGAWVGAVRPTAAVLRRVDAGELRAFSIFGHAERVAKALNGVPANELLRPKITHVSLVSQGANGETFIAKTTDVLAQQLAEIRETIHENQKRFERAEALLERVNQAPLFGGVRKTADARDEHDTERVRDLRRQLAAWNTRLHQSWNSGDVRLEKRALLEIDGIETSLLALDHDTRPSPHDNFRARGGTSEVLYADMLDPHEALLGRPRDPEVAKAADEIDLSDDAFGISTRRGRRR